MIRAAYIALGVGVAALVALYLAAHLGGRGAPFFYLGPYLAAWVFILSASIGALPLVALHDFLALPETPLSATLRTLLAAAPIVAVLAIPILVNFDVLYPAETAKGFAGWWNSQSFRFDRSIAYLVIWVWLSMMLVLGGPAARSRRSLAWPGLAFCCYIVIGSLSAADWIGAVEPQFNSSVFGLIALAAQVGLALSLAAFVVLRRGRAVPASLAPTLLILLLAWVALQFTQYLVFWSADLPSEAAWYLHRNSGTGQIAEIVVVICAFLAALLITWADRARLALAAALIVLIHCLEAIWLVTPAHGGRLSFTYPDALSFIGLFGILIAVTLLTRLILPVEEFEPVAAPPLGLRASLSSALTGVTHGLSSEPRLLRGWRQSPRAHAAPPILEEHAPQPHEESEEVGGYEPRDADARRLAVIIFVVAGSIAVCIGGLFSLLDYFHAINRPTEPLTPEEQASIPIPGPHLQSDPLTDLARLNSFENARLDSYRWLVRGQTAQIPINRAMTLMIGKSLDPGPASSGQGPHP